MTLQDQLPTPHSRPAETLPFKREQGAQGRLGKIRPVAVVDIGSNSVRQVIYEGMTRAPSVLFNEKVLCGLGRGILTSGNLDPEAVERALAALRRFRALGNQAGVGETHILATAAARDAANGAEFLSRVEALFFRKVMLLTGSLEAQYSAWGIKSGFYKPNGIVGDLGGGSLELVAVNGEIGGGLTLPLGGLRLADAAEGKLDAAARIIRKTLSSVDLDWPGAGRDFYAVGGTWRSLAKLHIANTGYPLHVLHDYTVDAAKMTAFCQKIASRPIESISGIDAVSRNRRTLLPYGALIMAAALRKLKAERVIVSSLGVREGYLYSLLSRKVRAEDSLLSAAYEFAILRARSPRHSVELAEWSGYAFDVLGVDETEDEARWRIAACYLADIAWRAHPDYRAQQSLSIIANAGFVGISHEGRAYLALANFHRYRGLSNKVEPPGIAVLAGPRAQSRARLLAAVFRVLYLFSASQAGVIPRLALTRRKAGSYAFIVPGKVAELCGERPGERIAQLARELQVEISVEIGDEET
jgi:exopolyphosphatase / guanosine-5'-triphosphate,3'-diphosphate pyrophosphatase